jgi:CRP/FNR family cyclic AMP-dependent transcriptional regulator
MPRGIPRDVIRHFQSIPLFESVSSKGIRQIVQAATEVDIQAGAVFVREGGFDRDLFVITRGEAVVTQRGRRLATLGPGSFFGELAFLDKSPRSATVTAATDMRVLVLGPRELGDIVEREPTIAKMMLESMARRIRANERSIQH